MIKNKILEQIKNNPELQKDAEFMQKAIAIDESFIAYDKSEDTEVYLTYIYKKIDQLKKDEQRNEALIECLENIGQEINNPKEVDKDKYKIPHKFLFERIKRCEKDGEPLSRYELNQYFILDGRYSKEFGETLQRLYDNPDYVFGIHGTSAVTKKEDIDKVLSEGLCATTQGGGPGHLASHVYYGDNIDFLQALSFVRNSINLAETMFILQIPRSVFDKNNPTPLYGSNATLLDEQAHILPEYMYGYTQRKAPSEYDDAEQQMFDRTLYKSDVEHQTYKYGFKEISVDDSKAPVILNEERREKEKDK